MVYDCFQFFNELDILELRLNILDSVVDKFVISESTVTFSGEKKPLFYDINRDLFKKFEHKILYNLVTDTPDVDPFQRDSFQKCAVKRGLVNCNSQDIIIFSDVDEIPNPIELKKVIDDIETDKIYHMAQRNFYCFLNNEEVTGNLLSITGEFEGIQNKKWLGTKVFRFSMLANSSLEELRNQNAKRNGIRVENGGWHFSYMGGNNKESVNKRVAYKIRSAAHQEFNNTKTMIQLGLRIRNGKDLFGRKAKFEKVVIDESFPRYLQENQDKYKHLIKK